MRDEYFPFENSTNDIVFNDKPTIIGKVWSIMHKSKSDLQFCEAELEHIRSLIENPA